MMRCPRPAPGAAAARTRAGHRAVVQRGAFRARAAQGGAGDTFGPAGAGTGPAAQQGRPERQRQRRAQDCALDVEPPPLPEQGQQQQEEQQQHGQQETPQSLGLLRSLWAYLAALSGPRWQEAHQGACLALAAALLLSSAVGLQAAPPARAAAAAALAAPEAAVVAAPGGGAAAALAHALPAPPPAFNAAAAGAGPSLPRRWAAAAAGPSQQQQQQQQGFDWRFDRSSEMEDNLLEAARQVGARLDSAFDVISSGLEGSRQGPEAVQQAADTLINEVWAVVDASYMDARQAGFDRDKWAALRDKALARRYKDMGAVHRAVRDMVARGLPDPYCRWVPPSEFAAMKKYDVTGVGLNLGTAEEFVKKTGLDLPSGGGGGGGSGGADVWVVGISKGSAADAAGVEQGDQLLAVDGRPLAGLSPFQASAMISSPPEDEGDVSGGDGSGSGGSGGNGRGGGGASTVTLRVRKAGGAVREYEVPRPVTQQASPVTYGLQARAGGRRVGAIAVKSFTARAQRDVAAAVRDLAARGAQELELDLRDNRGGLVTEGLEVARLFLDGGVPIVLTESKAMASAPPAASGPALTALPLTVLVNDHTASASEILAGALKDNCRAVLVGGRTYGKGLIQSVYELSDQSGLVITVGKYLTPGGVDIDRFGIEPDFRTAPPPGRAEEALQACRVARGLAGEGAGAGGGGARPPQELLLTGESRAAGGGGGGGAVGGRR